MTELREHLFVPYSELQEGDELTDAITIAKSYYLKSEADKVIAEKDKEIRRLRRALYKACANWAHVSVAFFSSYVTKEKWRKMENKCRAKEEGFSRL